MKKQLTISKSGALPRSLHATWITALHPNTKKIASIKTNFASRAAFFNLRVLIGFALCSVGLLPASAQIGGGGTTNYIPLWTGSSTLGDSAIYQSGSNIGIGTIVPVAALDVVNSRNPAILGSTQGRFGAVVGLGAAIGVAGHSNSSSGIGVLGLAEGTSGSGVGVSGVTSGPTGIGVLATSNSMTGANYAVYGSAKSPDAVGSFGYNSAATGEAIAVEGESSSSSGIGVFGVTTSTDTSFISYGVYGQSINGRLRAIDLRQWRLRPVHWCRRWAVR